MKIQFFILVILLPFIFIACTTSLESNSKNESQAQNNLWEDYLLNKTQLTNEKVSSTKSQNLEVMRCLNSCVRVYALFKTYSNLEEKSKSYSTSILCGSGVIIDIQKDNSYILTNYHVIYNAYDTSENKTCFKACAYTYTSNEYPTQAETYYDTQKRFRSYDFGKTGIELTFVIGSATLDLAILKCATTDLLTNNKNALSVCLASNYSVGDNVFAIGNPNNEGLSVTSGIISVENEDILLNIGGKLREYPSIRTDTSIYSGSSGGGLFNLDGELVGITNAGDSVNQNINYAIPIQIVYYFVHGFLADANFSPSKLLLGISLSTTNTFDFNIKQNMWQITKSCIIESIDKDSVAERIGLKPQDQIEQLIVDNQNFNINKTLDLKIALMFPKAYTTLSIIIIRNDRELKLDYDIKSSDLITLT